VSKRSKQAAKTTDIPSEPPASRWRDALILSVIVLAGLGLRGAYLAELVHKPDYDAPLRDALYNDYWAHGLVTGDWTPPAGQVDPQIPTTPYFRPPGYAYFLAAVYWVTGPGYLGPRLVQMVLGLVNIVLAFFVGRAVFNRVVGLIGAALIGGYWGLIYFEGEFHPKALLVALLLLLVLVLHGWVRRPTFWRVALAGFLLGLVALLRSNVLLFAPVLLIWVAWVLRRRGALRRLPLTAGVLGAALVAPIVPATIRNYVVGHEFVPISTNGGINLYMGNNPQTSLVTPELPEVEQLITRAGWSLFRWAEVVHGVALQEGRPMTHTEVSDYFTQRALAFIRTHPLESLGYAVKRVALLWGPQEISNNKVDGIEHARSRTLWWLPGFPTVLAGFVFGLLLWWADRRASRRSGPPADDTGRARGESGVLMLLFVLAYSASFVPFLVAGRYRVPYIPLLLLFAAYGLWRLGQFVTARRGRALLLGVVGWGAAWGLAHIQIVPYKPDLGSWYLDRATAYTQKGALDPAIREYRAAIEANPDFPVSYAALAATLTLKGDHDGAIAAYRAAVARAPRSAEMWQALAKLLHEKKQLDEAIQAYRAAAEIAPNSSDTWYQLGRALGTKGADADALGAYRRVLDLNPQSSQARVNAAIILQKQGDLAAAVVEYRRAIADEPNLFEAHYNLAGALRTQGDLDGAYREISLALNIQPRHPAAQSALKMLQEERQQASSQPTTGRVGTSNPTK
jgi:tetratricopeptide (TPR) repeat protein